ncbi:MAG: hypothetical protein LBJ15_20755 [Comamonas sp.]|jgi:hypothetical protein|uniref:hypothetical protein n=1 Tax=Comamonas sp. TaxID=34028 RepID=UPI0028277423|nr:hypothetical protein [Comamonas sp.]MDR0216409.1 hypothetical protein [Comamonas sp.]
MADKKEFNQKDNLIALVIFMFLTCFLARSNFYSFDDVGFFASFFTTNAVYSGGENIGGVIGALAYIRSMMYILFLALMWQLYSAKKKTQTYFLFFAIVGFVLAKIGLDYFVFGNILNARGELYFGKIMIITFLFLCIYEGMKRINFRVTQ